MLNNNFLVQMINNQNNLLNERAAFIQNGRLIVNIQNRHMGNNQPHNNYYAILLLRQIRRIVKHDINSRLQYGINAHTLQNNPRIKLALEYHISRIGRLLGKIPINELTNLLAPMTEPEIRVFRNIIAHDINEPLITGIPMEAFLCRYTALILQKFPQVQPQRTLPPGP